MLDRIADPALQGMARLAAHIAGVSSAAIHVVGADTQHRIAGYAAPLGDSPVSDSMCRLVVESKEAIVVGDAVADGRFAYSSLVAGEAPVRFYASFPMRTGEGEVIGTVCAFDTRTNELCDQAAALIEDIALQASTHLDLMRLVGELGTDDSRDELTGAANRLVLGDRLAHHLARIRRHGTQLVVAAVEIQGLDEISANLGHGAGDRLLQEVARRLAARVRAEDMVARVGEREFVVVAELPEQGLELESFRDRLGQALTGPFTLRGKLVESGARVGAVIAEREETASAILARADAEMKLQDLAEDDRGDLVLEVVVVLGRGDHHGALGLGGGEPLRVRLLRGGGVVLAGEDLDETSPAPAWRRDAALGAEIGADHLEVGPALLLDLEPGVLEQGRDALDVGLLRRRRRWRRWRRWRRSCRPRSSSRRSTRRRRRSRRGR